MLDHLPSYDDWLEVTNLLLVRDGIEEAISGGALLDEQRARLREADDRLVASRDLLLRFPEVFEARGVPRSLWWWYLHEAPHVRERSAITAPR